MPCSKSVNAFVKSTCELDFFPPKFDFLNELVFLAFVNEVLLCTDELVFVLLLVLLLLLLLLLFDDLLLEDDEFGFFLDVTVVFRPSTCAPLIPGCESFSNILESKEKCVSCVCMPT